MVFIDGSNIHHAVKRCEGREPGFKIDYQKLLRLLVSDRKLCRAYYFGSRPIPPVDEQESFYKKLRHEGFSIEIKPLRARKGKRFEKGVDVALVTFLLSFGYRNIYDTAVIVSGDQDFLEAIKDLKYSGKRVELAAFEDSVNADFKLCADEFISLDKHLKEIQLANDTVTTLKQT